MESSPRSRANHEATESEKSILNAAAVDPTGAECCEPVGFLASCNEQDVDASNDLNSLETSENHDVENFPVDEIPEPIKVLDEIISEFEECLKPPVHNGENQSEDDGYMSLSRKNMRKEDDCEDFATNESQNYNSLELPQACIQNFDTYFGQKEEEAPAQESSRVTELETFPDQNLNQSTLPKARTTSCVPNYSSLPCCAKTVASEPKVRMGSFSSENRNVLGIDISAVHKAVLQGGFAHLPETIVNEHPVTIYPGSYSPTEGSRKHSQRLLPSAKKQREAFQTLNPPSSSSSSSSYSYMDCKVYLPPKQTTEKSFNENYIKRNLSSTGKNDMPDGFSRAQAISPPQQKQTSVAWEIHFKSNKKKSSSSSKKKHTKKNYSSVNSARASYVSDDESLEYLGSASEKLDYIGGNELVLDSDECEAQKLNYCMSRHKNMLGKGTFVIRRSPRKSPAAIEIFDIPAVDTKNAARNYMGANEVTEDLDDISMLTDVSSSISRQSPELELSLCSSLISSRDRLSLNIDSQYQNMLTQEQTGKHQALITSMEDLSNCLQSLHLRPSDSQLSLESLDNKISISKDELQHDNVASLHLFEAYNTFPYKNDHPNGSKPQEFLDLHIPKTTTPHTDLAPTLEEDEDLSDLSFTGAPLRQIENNISALLRGELPVIRAGNILQHPKRTLEFRPGVHKSESAKEMLLSQNAFGPLPASPPSSNPDLFDYDALPPLPPSPTATMEDDNVPRCKPYTKSTVVEVHSHSFGGERRSRDNISALRHLNDDMSLLSSPLTKTPPAVPPHRGRSANTIKSWSIDSNFQKRSKKTLGYGSSHTTLTAPQTTKRFGSCAYGTKRNSRQSPLEENRLQTSCSLPETPIFARGCDIPRTPFRRHNEGTVVSGSRTAPRSNTAHSIAMGNSIIGISGGGTFTNGMCRQRSINHALASNEMLRLSGAPARGWYPKQRNMRPASTENIDRLTSIRGWDSAVEMSGSVHTRKPLTLPPNYTPSFLNKSPREALRRVTSLLITKKKNTKERKKKPHGDHALDANHTSHDMKSNSSGKDQTWSSSNGTQKSQKKKSLFKNLWKRTKQFSLDQ